MHSPALNIPQDIDFLTSLQIVHNLTKHPRKDSPKLFKSSLANALFFLDSLIENSHYSLRDLHLSSVLYILGCFILYK